MAVPSKACLLREKLFLLPLTYSGQRGASCSAHGPPDRGPLWLFPAGPDVNAGLVLEQKQMEEATRVRMASCPSHPGPTSTSSSTYVNYGFEHSSKSGLHSSLPRSGH